MSALHRNKGRLFGVALFLLLLAGGGWWLARSKPLAVVGQTSISEADTGYRIGLQRAYGVTIGRSAALVSLVNDALEREVARAAGILVTEKNLDVFSNFVDHNSKAPKVLKKVKQVFGGDLKSYRQLYLAPKVRNRKLRDWFSRDAAIQQKPRAEIQKAYALAAAGNDFGKIAKVVGLKFVTQDYDTDKKQAPDALHGYFPDGIAMLSPGFQKLLDGLRNGEMAQTISEDDSSYRVVRLLAKGEGSYKTAEIIAMKAPFDAWFRVQVKKQRVRINDTELRASVAAKYPSLAWLDPKLGLRWGESP